MTKAIYRPRGAALEYAPPALNLYRGCTARCRHGHLEDKSGAFKAWTWEQVWVWCARTAELQRAQYGAARERGLEVPL